MKNNDDIPSTDTNEIKHLINRVKQGELDQDEALLIEKLLNIRVLAVTGRRIWFLLTFTALILLANVCRERARARCRSRDGGRPSEAGLQEQASNNRKLRW